MAVTRENRVVFDATDDPFGTIGGPFHYTMTLVVDVQDQPFRETLIAVIIDGRERSIPVNYRVNYGTVVRIDSTLGDPNFPPVAPGQQRTWTLGVDPGTGTGPLRIDNRGDAMYALW